MSYSTGIESCLADLVTAPSMHVWTLDGCVASVISEYVIQQQQRWAPINWHTPIHYNEYALEHFTPSHTIAVNAMHGFTSHTEFHNLTSKSQKSGVRNFT